VVCVREIQKSITFSSKLLLEDKINSLGLSGEFQIQNQIIKRSFGKGFIIFVGMQDHNSDSIKGLEGFDLVWVEEAANLSQRSLDLLLPTIRKPGSEIWFTWNPETVDNAVDRMFRGEHPAQNSVILQVNYLENPHLSDIIRNQAEDMMRQDYEKYLHIWMGGYRNYTVSQVLKNWVSRKVTLDPNWDGPYYGNDWGFSDDPTTAVECWVNGKFLYISRESHEYHLTLERTAAKWREDIPGIENHTVRSDPAQSASINHVKRSIPKLVPAKKGPGSVEDGVIFLQNFETIFINPDCSNMLTEAKLWSYRTNKAGDVLAELKPGNDHLWDAVRYALEPLIRMAKNSIRSPIAQPKPINVRNIFNG
jgi:phage terminase large subunit